MKLLCQIKIGLIINIKHFIIKDNLRREIAGDNELMIECSFQAVKDSTNEAIKIYSLYDDALYDLSA